MKFRKIGLTAAACAALLPALCQAGPERDALKACAQAFASSLATPGAPVVAFKVNYRSNQSTGSMLEFYSREYTFDLHANDSKTGTAIARARCSTDIHGAVLALSPIPLNVEHPALAARL
jgi:pseudouridine-5'-phosphate glycosidase